MDQPKLCGRCEEQPRRPRQRWCKDCHASYVREQRQKHAEARATREIEGRMSVGDRAGVYFIRCDSFVKIGVATNVVNRFQQIKTANPFPVAPLGFIPEDTVIGADKLEFDLHCRFGQLHHRGEWFKLVSPLAEFIAENAKPWPVLVDNVFHVERAKTA
jgi:hypothetical protein